MLQLDTTTISTADDITLGINKFKIIESPGKIIFYDAEKDDGFSISGDFDNNVIKNDILEHFKDEYERKGALGVTTYEISEYIWNNRTDNDGIYRLEGAYLNIPGNQEDVWVKSYDNKYAAGLDEALIHSFGDTAIRFGIKYPLHKENPETDITFKIDPDGTSLVIKVKGDTDTAKMMVENTIKHFKKEQDMSMLDINTYLKIQRQELYRNDVINVEQIVLGDTSFSVMESPWNINFIDKITGEGRAFFGNLDHSAIKKDLTEHFSYWEGNINFYDIADHFLKQQREENDIYKNFTHCEVSKNTIEQQYKDVWIKNDKKQYSFESDETFVHDFDNKTVRFGIIYSSEKDHETIITYKRENYWPNNIDLKFPVKGDIDTAKMIVDNTIIYFDQNQRANIDNIRSYITLQIMELSQEEKINNPQDLTVQLAKQAGYVQGVCECIAAIGNDHTLEKKLLSEMNVTKDMAKKYANPETFKALEQGIFAQEPEQSHSRNR